MRETRIRLGFAAGALAAVPLIALTAQLHTASAFIAPSVVRKSVKSQYEQECQCTFAKKQSASSTLLFVSIGLGPTTQQDDEDQAVVSSSLSSSDDADYEIPNHEAYRTSRRSKLDEQCDAWFAKLLGMDGDSADGTTLGHLVTAARNTLLTPVPLINEFEKPRDDPEWTPYVSTRLPWTPLLPSYGLEQFGLPVPRRNSEAWRHFDVPGLVGQDYSAPVPRNGLDMELADEQVSNYSQKLQEKGAWLSDDACYARLVYINGRFAPQLSKTVTSEVTNLATIEGLSDEVVRYLSRLTDGFTDDLVIPCRNGQEMQTSYQKLSYPDHCIGSPMAQFAINTQLGTACFAALNTIKAGSVAYVHIPAGDSSKMQEEDNGEGNIKPSPAKPVLIVNALTRSGGRSDPADIGVNLHPRTMVIAEDHSRLALIQTCVDLDDGIHFHTPKLYNGYTQIFVKAGANVTHSYLEESGGVVTAGVEIPDDQFKADTIKPREFESQRAELKDTHLEAVDVHVMGEAGRYQGTTLSIGGSGRVRLALSVTLLQPSAEAQVNGFSLSGGAQRTDVKTNIHHIAQGSISRQVQKNMIGGRAVGAFRGRIRVEQSAQQTDSAQVSRNILLSDKARAWAVPTLEIIADDVSCTHGATVSDLSEEELFYLRSRGLTRSMARNLLMFAFAGDISSKVDPSILGAAGGNKGLRNRIMQRLENLAPQAERAIKGEYQSI